ncbi:uncharacterized protein TNCV_4480431 [Trichonephila clavipes]|nr:uncharacterized protein TNCV_4480431 [Trichonephila clavipes]
MLLACPKAFSNVLKSNELKPDTIDRVILAACSLHNWLRKTSPGHYMPQNALDREDFNTGEVTPGQWRLHANTLRPVTSLGSNNPNRTAIQIRQQFMKYFTEENPLPWQWEKLGTLKNVFKIFFVIKFKNKM